MNFDFDDNGSTDTIRNDNKPEYMINIRVQQRNGRKSWTSIEGLYDIDNLDLKTFLKSLKKLFCCNGCIKKDEETSNEFIQLQGDFRTEVRDRLIKEYGVSDKKITVHGF